MKVHELNYQKMKVHEANSFFFSYLLLKLFNCIYIRVLWCKFSNYARSAYGGKSLAQSVAPIDIFLGGKNSMFLIVYSWQTQNPLLSNRLMFYILGKKIFKKKGLKKIFKKKGYQLLCKKLVTCNISCINSTISCSNFLPSCSSLYK